MAIVRDAVTGVLNRVGGEINAPQPSLVPDAVVLQNVTGRCGSHSGAHRGPGLRRHGPST